MIDKIQYRENSYFAKICSILQSKKDVYIYGAGVMGKAMASLLGKYGATIVAFVVDDAYYQEASEIWIDAIGKQIPILAYSKTKIENAIVISAIELRNQNVDEQFKKVQNKFELADVYDFEHINLFVCEPIDYLFFLEHRDAFQSTYDLLDDELSKEIMVAFVNACISENSRQLDSFCDSSYYKNDYDYELLLSKGGKNIIECGAFDGKTAVQFAGFLQNDATIYALEPDEDCYCKLQSNTKEYSCIKPMNFGAGEENKKAFFVSGNNGTSTIVAESEAKTYDSYQSIDIKKIDEFFGNIRVDSIIMDVEGSELETLRGAEEIIKRDLPTLGVRIYHKKDDLIKIPQYINSLFKEKKYNYYLRKNTMNRGYMDTTFYAIPR